MRITYIMSQVGGIKKNAVFITATESCCQLFLHSYYMIGNITAFKQTALSIFLYRILQQQEHPPGGGIAIQLHVYKMFCCFFLILASALIGPYRVFNDPGHILMEIIPH